MHRRVDLHCWPEKSIVADTHATHIENNTIEIKEDSLAQFNVRTVVAIEGRLHPYGRAAFTEQRAEYLTSFVLLGFPSCIQVLTEIACSLTCRNQLGIERVVQFSCEHFMPFSHAFLRHRMDSSPTGVVTIKAYLIVVPCWLYLDAAVAPRT